MSFFDVARRKRTKIKGTFLRKKTIGYILSECMVTFRQLHQTQNFGKENGL